MKCFKLLFVVCSLLLATTAHAEKITIAAAADLKFAMDEIVTGFNKNHPGNEVAGCLRFFRQSFTPRSSRVLPMICFFPLTSVSLVNLPNKVRPRPKSNPMPLAGSYSGAQKWMPQK